MNDFDIELTKSKEEVKSSKTDNSKNVEVDLVSVDVPFVKPVASDTSSHHTKTPQQYQ